MNERQASEAVVEWLAEALEAADVPAIPDESRYPYPVAEKLGAFTNEQPDVTAVVDRKRTGWARDFVEEGFPELAIQQNAFARVFDVAASLMLAVENAETSAREVHQRLQRFGEIVELAALDDLSLGGRVSQTSLQMAFDYSTPFARTSDGATGRMLVIELKVAEVVASPE